VTGPLFIAEVKTRSPFGYEAYRSSGYLTQLACRHGDAVAAHTDPRWGGSFEHLAAVATLAHGCGKLVLAKGVHAEDDDIRRALQCGADLVLVVGRRPPADLREVCLIEPQGSFWDWPQMGDRIVVNRRNLATGKQDGHDFNAIRHNWPYTWLCQASFIRTPGDVHRGAQAFIVGEHLERYCACLPTS
jgi:indole-3-glycerol phosphate synthase